MTDVSGLAVNKLFQYYQLISKSAFSRYSFFYLCCLEIFCTICISLHLLHDAGRAEAHAHKIRGGGAKVGLGSARRVL